MIVLGADTHSEQTGTGRKRMQRVAEDGSASRAM